VYDQIIDLAAQPVESALLADERVPEFEGLLRA
jgi:hypothetical protein